MAALANLQRLKVYSNKLQGSVPEALQSCVQLVVLRLDVNAFLGSIPQAVGFLARLQALEVGTNGLQGAIPDATASLVEMGELRVGHNSLQGAVPRVVERWMYVRELDLGDNALSGSLPVAVCCLTRMRFFYLSENRLSGSVSESMASLGVLRRLVASMNSFYGSIPDAVANMKSLIKLRLEWNALSGTIPVAISSLESMKWLALDANAFSGSIPVGISMRSTSSDSRTFSASRNQLAGSIGAALIDNLPEHFIVNQNRLTGTFTRPRGGCQMLSLACNMLEGPIPELPLWRFSPTFLDMSGEASKKGGLRGPLPHCLRRAKVLSRLGMAHQDLEGFIPPLSATLAMLALHNNGFKTFGGANFKRDGVVLLFNNLLSCHLPRCARQSVNLSMSLLGNRLQRPDGSFPAWVLPMERDRLFLTTGKEGLLFTFQVIGASSCLALVVVSKLGHSMLAGIMTGWHCQTGSHEQLALASSRLLSCIGHACLLRVVSFMHLLLWELYKCPPGLALASACLRGSGLTSVLVLASWYHLTFISPSVRCLASLRGTQEVVAQSIIRRSLFWLVWLFLTLVFSSLSILSQVGKSVPGLVHNESSWVALITVSVGAIQGVFSAFVIPHLAQKLSSKKHALITTANLLMNFLFPAGVIFYLDTGCLGRWVTLWAQCGKGSAAQFDRLVWCNPQRGCSAGTGNTESFIGVEVLKVSDICNPLHARRPTSLSRCMELTLLRLQDFWLKKLVVGGLLLPACRIATDKWYANLAEGTSKLVILLAYAIAASGHLPLMMPLLLLLMSVETLMTASSLHLQSLRGEHGIGFATQGLLMTQVLSAAMQLAFASGDLVLSALVLIAFTLYIAVITTKFRTPYPPQNLLNLFSVQFPVDEGITTFEGFGLFALCYYYSP